MNWDEDDEGDEDADKDEEEKHFISEEVGVCVIEDEFGRWKGVGNYVDHIFGECEQWKPESRKIVLEDRWILDIKIESDSYKLNKVEDLNKSAWFIDDVDDNDN